MAGCCGEYKAKGVRCRDGRRTQAGHRNHRRDSGCQAHAWLTIYSAGRREVREPTMIAAAVQWAERIMRKDVSPRKPRELRLSTLRLFVTVDAIVSTATRFITKRPALLNSRVADNTLTTRNLMMERYSEASRVVLQYMARCLQNPMR